MKFLLISFFLILMFAGSRQSQAQELFSPNNEDLVLISEHRHDREIHQRKARFRYLGSSAVARYNPVSLTLSSMLFVYQRLVSNTLSDRCIYHPSCSNFSAQAINENGFVLGILLTTDRISRCNKIAAWDLPPHRLDENRGRFLDEINRYRREP